jgi:C4-dicarboxylate transporter DctM subunit
MEFLILVVLPAVLLFLGVPIFAVLIAAGAVGLYGLGLGSLTQMHQAMVGNIDSFPLLAVPLFILAGEIMGRGGIARRLVDWVLSIIGGVRGSLSLTTIGSAELFGAMSGSSVGCVAAIGRLLMPSLTSNGYSRSFAGSLICSSGCIATIIPPSIPMIIYGVAAQQSVPKLFLAGIVPGILIGGLVSIYLLYYARKNNIPRTEGTSLARFLTATREAFWSLLAPVVVLGGIYGGVATPTEAAGVACVYAAFVSMFIYREMSLAKLVETVLDAGKLVAQILVIVAAAGAYSYVITTSGMPAKLVAFIQSLDLSLWMLLLVINVILLFVGSVLEPPAAILILAPLLVPIVGAAGMDQIHFGIIVTVNLALGMFMPPFGLNIFATHALFGVPMVALYRGILPFLGIYLIALALITYVPAITLAPLRLFGIK